MRQKKKSPKIIKKQNLQIDFRLRVYNKAVNRKKPHQGGVTVKKLLALTIALTVFVTSASACSKKEESSDPAPEKKVEYTKKEVNAYPLGEKEPLEGIGEPLSVQRRRQGRAGAVCQRPGKAEQPPRLLYLRPPAYRTGPTDSRRSTSGHLRRLLPAMDIRQA